MAILPRSVQIRLLLPSLLVPLACGSEPGSPEGTGGLGSGGGDGGSLSSGGSSGGTGTGGGVIVGTGGVVATGGVPASGAGPSTGGSSSGGAPSSGGSSGGQGGSTGGGLASGGGTPSGGSPATGGQDGVGGGKAARPSAGCGKAGRPSEGKVYVAGESWLLFPESYDGQSPLPVLFGFHGCGNGNRGDASRTEYTDLTKGTAFESEYVRAVPISTDGGGCWNYNTDVTRVKALYDKLTSEYCVDLDHIFATGHSSGSQFIVQLLLGSHTADADHFGFAGVAPVAASDYGPIATPTPVMYIQNQFDKERMSNGKDAVDRFVAGNQCGSSSAPISVMGAGCKSDGTTVDPGCVSYDGCAQPTIWCSHNDPAYSGTGHGVPCFAASATDEFFKSLP